MAVFVLLKSTTVGNFALYDDGKMVANFSHLDYPEYIEEQIARRMSEGDDLIERDHVGTFPEKLENKGVKNERLKALGNKKPSQVKKDAPEDEEQASTDS